VRPNPRLHPTPLCGPKIAAILKSRYGPNVVSIYQCGAGEAQAVGPLLDAKPIGVVSSARKG